LTQKELGDSINKSSQVISNWERGYRASIGQEDLMNLAKVFEKSIEEIAGSDYLLLQGEKQPVKRTRHTLAEVIYKTRKKAKLSQRQLGLNAGISRTEINRIETGKRPQPSLRLLEKLAQALDVSIDKLLRAAKLTRKYRKNKPRDLIKFIRKGDYSLNGQAVTPEEREKLLQLICDFAVQSRPNKA
jgi:transcriptional regulator with XRE-family HTH domain